MALKSVVEIDLQDSKFQRFVAQYEKVQQQIGKLPGAWKAIGKEQGNAAQQLERGGKALTTQNNAVREQLEEDKKRLGNLTLQEKLWQSMSKSSGSFAANVLGASKTLLKWGSLLGAGLIGGSLFGLDRLASRTSDARSSAMGLGLSIGAQKSFNLNFGRFFGGDAGGFLGGVAGAAADVSKQSALFALGVNPNQPTDQLAVATLKALRSKALGTPINQLGLLSSSYGLDQLGVNVEDLRRLRSASPQEFSAQLGKYGSDKAGLNIADDTARRWQNFDNQLTRAGEQISRTLVVGLEKAHIPEAMSHLSDAFSKFLQTLLKSDLVKDALTNLSTWLNNFSGTLDNQGFRDNISMFMSDAGDLTKTLHNILHPILALENTPWGSHGQTSAGFKDYLGSVDKKYGLPAGALESVFQTSGGNMYGVPRSSVGALGPMQLMPRTAAQYGVDATNPVPAGDAAGHYLSDLERKYKGDFRKALAAFTIDRLGYAVSDFDRYLAQRKGPEWISGLPQPVQSLLGQTSVTIKFVDTPGGATPVVASQLAALQ